MAIPCARLSGAGTRAPSNRSYSEHLAPIFVSSDTYEDHF